MKSRISIILLLILLIGCSLNKTNTPQEKKSAILKEAEIAKATVSQALVSDEIRCISAGASSVWVGTDRGVSVYHKGNGFDTPSATQPKSQWTALNREDGLVADDVTAIAVDGQLVWIGTRFGVSRYDVAKKTFNTFQRRDGLASNHITAIAVDGNYVWFGTDNGISRLDKTIGAWALKKEKGEDKLNKITAIAVEADYVWFGTQGGLRRYEKAKDSWNTYTEKDGLVQDYVCCIAVGEDSVWIGTEKSGVSQYSKTDRSFIKSYTKTDILSSNFIQAIAVDGSNIWFGSSDYGVRRYLTTVDTWFAYTTMQGLASDHITWITIDGNDIWMGTYEYGVSRYDKVANTWISYRMRDTLVSNHIKALAGQGSDVWIGTTEGLSRYDPIKREWKNYTKADGLVTNYITSLATDPTNHDGILWVGTSLGLGKFEQTSKKWRFYRKPKVTRNEAISEANTKADGPGDNFITNIGVEEHQIWVATRKGLYVSDRKPKASVSEANISQGTWRTYLADKWVTSVLPKNGEIWAGTTDGLYRLNSKEDKFEAISSVRNYVNTIAEIPPLTKGENGKLFTSFTNAFGLWFASLTDAKGFRFVGTRDGLFIVGENELSCFFDTVSPAKRQASVNSHSESYVEKTKKLNIEHLTIKDGLPNNNIRVIAPDGDSIWLGTPKGLARLHLPKRDIQIFTMRSGGLLHDNIQSILVQDENIRIGTVAGLSSYDKQNNQWDSYKPYPTTQVLREDNINWIQEDERNLWVLNWSESPNGAIMKFDKDTQTWIKYTREEIPLSDEVPWITEVRRMAIDGDDVWFATNGGVLKYNKESDTWIHFTKSNGLPGHRALFVEIDKINPQPGSVDVSTVWVAFHGGMASYYDKNSGIWQTLKVTRAGVGTNIDAIAFTEKYVWFSTGSTGIRRYDRATKAWTSYTEAQGMASRSGPWLVADGQDIWTGGWGTYSWISDRGSGGVSKYDTSTDAWSIYDKSKGLLADGMEYGQVSGDYVWCFGRGGINRYDKKTKMWISLTQSDGLPDWSVNAVIEDGNVLWVGTGGKGVCKYFLASGAWTAFTKEDGLADDSINEYALSVDDQYVWAGTKEGLSRYDKEKETWISFTKPQTLASRRVLTVAVDSRYVWCGTHRGLSRYDKLHDTWKHFQKAEKEERPPWEQPQEEEKKKEKRENELVDNNVVALSVGERYVWIATEGGVGRYDKIANRFEAYTKENKLPSADVRTIGESHSDIWIGTSNGLSKHSILSDDPNAWETYNAAIEIEPMVFDKQYAQSLVHDDVRCLTVDDNRIWIGTKTGVSLYDIKKGLWQTFTQKDGLASSEVSCIAVDGDIVWFGSGRGATSYNAKTQKWQTYHKTKSLVNEVNCKPKASVSEANTVNDGLASNHITSIAVNKKQVWFGTFDKGVTIMDKISLKWRTLTIMDGLPHNGILAIVMDNDNVWIGTHGGLVRYSISTETFTVYTEQFDLDGI